MRIDATSATVALDVDYFRGWQDDNVPPPSDSADTAPNGDDLQSTPPLTVDNSASDNPDSFFSFNAATSEDTVFNKDVYVHGTLFADKIKANEIEGLSVFTDELASLQQKINGNSSSNPGSLSNSGSTIQTATLSLNLKDGLVVGGDTEFHGNALFYKLVTFMEKTVFNNDVTFAAHVTTSGSAPDIKLGTAAGITSSNDGSANLATKSIIGNDNSGQITVKVGDNSSTGELLTITFDKPFEKTPQILLTPASEDAAQLKYYVLASPTGFKLRAVGSAPTPSQNLVLNYWVIQ
jgi:hypothetical protein